MYEEASSRFEGVLSAPRAPRTLGRSPDESGWRGRRVGGRNHAVGGRRSRLSRPKWRWWCLIHRADDPSFDVSVAWAHWASTPRSAAVRAAVGSLPALVTSRRAPGSRSALTLTASPRRDVADLDSTTVLIDGFPGAARRTAATYVLTNTHRPTPSGRSVQNHRDTDANRISHRREPRRVGRPRARSMLKMCLVHPRKVILASRPPKII